MKIADLIVELESAAEDHDRVMVNVAGRWTALVGTSSTDEAPGLLLLDTED